MWRLGVFFFVIFCGEYGTHSQLRDRGPGPWFEPTKGEPWPKPQERVDYDGFLVVRPTVFKFKVLQDDCDILRAAIVRYSRIIQQTVSRQKDFVRVSHQKTGKDDPEFRAYLDALEIRLMAPCEKYPYLNMDERYELRINSPEQPGAAVLTSQSIWGILRGLETFSQLLFLDPDAAELRINSCAITDFPRYSHRGLLLDTSRHFFPVPVISRTLDAMEANKFNVFHWHIVDDQSFPYQSAAFPQLSEMGAYNPYSQVYTREDIRYVVEYARLRGIRVIAEFDTPGHTQSWGLGIKNLLTPCYKGDTPDGTFGPMNPIDDSTYKFMETFLAEAVELFPEKYIHLGGDEVSFDCWASNPDIKEYMESNNITGNYAKLEEIYIQRLVDIASELKASSLVWQEVFDNGVNLPEDTVVHIWTGNQQNELSKVTGKGYPALLSTCWYLSEILSGGNWQRFYLCDPNNFDGTEEQKRLVMGGEVCMWSEYVDPSSMFTRVWPRAAAAAEKLWSSGNVTSMNDAIRRLEEHTCRMNLRDIPAQPPNGPSTCPYIPYYYSGFPI